jgi:hypothetical protein
MQINSFMKKLTLILLLLLFVSCANRVDYQIDQTQHIYGFWGGVWHGMIMLPDFIGSLIWDDVAVYATNNNGTWYDFDLGGLSIIIKFICTLLKMLNN